MFYWNRSIILPNESWFASIISPGSVIKKSKRKGIYDTKGEFIGERIFDEKILLIFFSSSYLDLYWFYQ